MKNLVLALSFTLSLFTVGTSVAQKNTNATSAIVSSNKTIYAKAIEYGDLNTAIVAAHTILANSPNDYHYMDSLVGLYYTSGNLVAAVNVGNDILAAAPQNTTVRELVANSLIALDLSADALVHYNELYTRTGNLVYLYNVATTQFNMKNYTDCGFTVERLLKAESNMVKVNIATAEGDAQDVPIKAAALNIKGAIAMELNSLAIAKENFEEALKVAPDFALAKNNLETLANRGK